MKHMTEWQTNVYTIYHNLKIKVLLDDKNNLLTIYLGRKETALYIFNDETVSFEMNYIVMTLHKFVKLLKTKGIEFFSYYTINGKYYLCCLDTVLSFRKRSLNAYLKKHEDHNYDFLFDSVA